MYSSLVKRSIFSRLDGPRCAEFKSEKKMESYEVTIKTVGGNERLDVTHMIMAETPLFALNQVLLDIQSQQFSDDTRQWTLLNEASDIDVSVKIRLG